MPLPPYIKSYPKNPDDYQTVYAQDPGSAAAPTAGLHFTPELLENIRQMGVCIEKITLHVGLDTFLPVREEHPEEHKIHSEWCHVSQRTVDVLRQAKERGKRIIAVGTTTVRTLETLAQVNPKDPLSKGYEGTTRLYILPGFSFRIIDAMITNFHLPKSTLLMLVCAFAGRSGC
jgi:S-adenosylmethionine:tRNA ribosyltransferase-isomerase